MTIPEVIAYLYTLERDAEHMKMRIQEFRQRLVETLDTDSDTMVD